MDEYDVRPNALGDGWIISKRTPVYTSTTSKAEFEWIGAICSIYWALPTFGMMSIGSERTWQNGLARTSIVWAIWIAVEVAIYLNWRRSARQPAAKHKRRLATVLLLAALPVHVTTWFVAYAFYWQDVNGIRIEDRPEWTWPLWTALAVPVMLCMSTALSPTQAKMWK